RTRYVSRAFPAHYASVHGGCGRAPRRGIGVGASWRGNVMKRSRMGTWCVAGVGLAAAWVAQAVRGQPELPRSGGVALPQIRNAQEITLPAAQIAEAPAVTFPQVPAVPAAAP